MDGTLLTAPAFAAMLTLFKLDRLTISAGNVVPDPEGSNFRVTGQLALLGTMVSDVDLYFEAANDGEYEFQLSGVCAALSLRTLLNAGLLPARRLESMPELLDLSFDKVQLVYDSERQTLFFGVTQSPHQLDLFKAIGLEIARLGFEFVRYDADNSALLMLHASIPIGETQIAAELDLPVDDLRASGQWVLRFDSPVQLEQGLRDLTHLLGQTTIGKEVGLTSWESAFPERLTQIPALFLSAFEVKFTPRPLRLNYLAFTVESTYELRLGSTAFVLDRIGAGVTVVCWQPATSIRLLLFGHVAVNEFLSIGLSVDIPVTGGGSWIASLQAEATLRSLHDIGNLPIGTKTDEYHLPSGFFELDSFDIRRFDVSFQPSNGIESVNLAITTQLTCKLGSALEIENPALTLNLINPFNAAALKQPRSITGTIRGVVRIGEVPFDVQAEKQTSGWRFSSRMVGLLNIDTMLEAIAAHFNLKLPPVLKDVVLTELALEFTTSSGTQPDDSASELTFTCVGQMPINGQRVECSIDVDIQRQPAAPQ